MRSKGIAGRLSVNPYKTMLEAGKVYRCNDGKVRWAFRLDQRGYFHPGEALRWLGERKGVLCPGGLVRPWGGFVRQEYPAPKLGETFLLMGPMGQPEERTYH